MKKVLFIVACIATLQLALCLRIAPPLPPKPCSLCKYHPCAATLCGPGTVATPDFCSCTCQCKPCFACLAVLCYPGRCKANEKCVQASCGCSYKCIPNCPTNKCAHIKCRLGAKCVQDQKTCSAKCVCSDKCKTSDCKSFGALCIQDKKTCNTRCECPQRKCADINKPVCGSNGITYKNDCTLNGVICKSKGAIKKARDGPCKLCRLCKYHPCAATLCGPGYIATPDFCSCTCHCKPCSRPCPEIYKPVCGTDGKTYSNECILNNAICKSNGRLQKKHNGKCKPCHLPCSKIYKPVCGTDGKTYSNQCILNVAICKSNGRLQKKHNGKCKPCYVCKALLCHPGRCKANEKCVQASCGCSYKCIPNCPTNKCAHIKCGFGARCVQDQKTCSAKCECPRFCILLFKPVCGSDGKTYSNECFLGVQACNTQGKVKKVSDGPCPVKCPDKCKSSKCKSYGALCRQDKKTCKTRCECPLRRCANINKPVCGTDGKTYRNDCILAGVICRSKGRIRKAKNGRCKPLCEFHNPCAGITCGSKKRCVPNFGACAYSCQPKVCPIQQCVQPACAGNPCVVGKCIEICKNSCVAACEITRGCDGPCTDEYDPYCASNKETYGNFCMFRIARCKSGNTLYIKKKGECH